MGCASSQIDQEERVQVCKERRMLMKQLLGFRAEFANAIVAYLKALKNTGVTLRQFTESESSEIENIPFSSGLLPSSSPPRLPPSPPPPPPPPFSPDLKGKRPINQNSDQAQEEIIEISEDNSSWDPLHLFEDSLAQHEVVSAVVGEIDEESWAETRSQFEEEEQENVTSNKHPDALIRRNVLSRDLVDDDLSMVSGGIKDDTAMVVWRSKKTLTGIVRELDDFFLKASAGSKEIAVLVDLGARNTYLHQDLKENKGKGNNSAKVLSSLSWGWSSRSMHLTSDSVDSGIPFEPCKPGANRVTLEKLYAQEQILYKTVKEEEMAKLEYERKSLSLKKQENDNIDLNKIEKTQFVVQNLQSDIARLQELVRSTSSCIIALINEELHLQLVALLSGLIHMWKTMYECHIAQSHICQQVKHLSNHQNTEPTSVYHRDATVQLENEVNFWYNSFCRLTKCQRQYVSSLCRWIELTDCLVDGENRNRCPSTVRTLCEKWKLALDRLPEQVVSEAIKSFLLVIRSILMQQEEERNLKKKCDKIERRLQKELNSLIEMEKRLEQSMTLGGDTDMETILSPKHPVSVKHAKTDALRKRYEGERAKYLSSVQVTRAMTLNNLHASLPRLFQALMGFSGACSQAFDIALGHAGNEQASDVEQQSHVDC